MARVGVFVCHCGLNIARGVDIEKLIEEIREYPDVVHAEDYKYMCSAPGQELVADRIREHDLDAVVMANCSPTLHEATFRILAQGVGLNPFRVEVANIREQCSWPHAHEWETATRKAIRLVQMAVEKVKKDRPLVPITFSVNKKALIIGGGIAGIQAALDIADGGYQVYLVERTSSIGGKMAQLSETFPTLDCPQCIMTPKMNEVGRHPNIQLLAYSEVEQVSGWVGNFTVKVRQKASYVDFEVCNGCGDCAEVCPVTVPDEFNGMLGMKHAVYRPFPQAVPNVFVIDKRGEPPCRATCPIHVNAQGYVALISQGKFVEALGLVRERNPFPGVTGRVCHHPCEEVCERGRVDEPIAICALKRAAADLAGEEGLWGGPEVGEATGKAVGVIGSGPAGLLCAYDLARRGHKVTVFEALPVVGGMLAVGIPSYRLPRDVLGGEVGVLGRMGVEIKVSTPIGGKVSFGDLLKGYDAVFMAPGCHVSRRLGMSGEELGGVVGAVEFLRAFNLGEEVEVGRRVAVVGGGNAAIDAARTALRLGAEKVTIVYRRSRVEMPANEEEIEEAEREGVEIHYLANPTKAMGEGKLERIECIRMELGEPDASGRRRPVPVEGSEFVLEVDMLIPAISQSPDLGYLGEGHGIELTRWGTPAVDEETLQTSVGKVFAGGDAVTGPATYIEAMAAGRKAAESIHRYLMGEEMREGREGEGRQETDVEAVTEGVEPRARVKLPGLSVERRSGSFDEVVSVLSEEDARAEADRCLDCGVCSECMECVKVCEKNAIDHQMPDRFVDLEVGAIIVATGFDLFPKESVEEYGLGTVPDVIDALQFERLLAASGPTAGEVRRPSDGRVPKEVVFIQCVGSRDPERYHAHCSRICCMYTAKEAMLYRHAVPDGQAYIFYMDIRSNGKGYEEFVQRGMEEDGLLYLRGRVSKVYREGDKVIVWGADTLTGQPVEIAADLVVLATAAVPSDGADRLAKTLRLPTDEAGFLKEAHLKLRPVEALTSGIYIAGAAQSPKDITDAVSQASGAAAKVLSLFSQEHLTRDPTIARVDEDVCAGCGYCVNACAYEAVSLDPITGKAKVNEVICEGCGACAATCPSGAMSHTNFGRKQILEMVSVATEDYEEEAGE